MTLRDGMENAVIPGYDNWGSNTHSAMLWIVLKCAGPSPMLLLLHSISQRQFRKINVHAAARIIQHMVQNRNQLFCAPLEEQFRDLSSALMKRDEAFPLGTQKMKCMEVQR
ncbi:hypothetical protein N7447_010055 [Penicillium robsamsonii]|uniref:uncharacterized protein n=1 Tax=Penicillium robsamsonii TaxID=1792511 RepID=UPI0025497617|nr:uncharacterized protein N7447_010055 [Penicillium robsamsonii]KAJ5813032.1 hypothetical protein N7447_010055 [Penicillium robsamsonii]